MSSISALGIGTGMDLNSMIDGLMKLEAGQQDKLKASVTKKQSLVTNYQTLNTRFANLKSVGEAINLGSSWKAYKATSTDSAVTATAATGAMTGSLSFAVKNLASAQTLASFGTVASTDTVIGSGSLLLGQAGGLGLANMTASGSFASGTHTIAVTQSSAGAAVNGSALASSVTLTGSETLTANVNGVAKSYNLTAGTYSQSELAAMVQNVSGGDLKVELNASQGLKVSTAREGSAATLQITGGTGLAKLGLTAGAAVAGTNGIVTVDGVTNTVTDVRPDGSNNVVLNGSAGTVTTSFQSGLRTGSVSVNNVSLGDGKLSTVVGNINSANIGVTAAAVQVAPNQYKLQIQSNATGTAGAVSMNFNAFAGSMGTMQTIAKAQDATLQVGSGAGAYNITSSTNTVTGVLPGVTLNLTAADPTKTITVGVAADVDGMADKVDGLIRAANDALSYITTNSTYDAKTKTAGALLGNITAQRLERELHRSITDAVTGGSLGNASQVGIKTNSDGSFTLDREKFKAAYTANPEAVAALFVEGGTTGVSTTNNPGIAERLVKVAKSATDSVSGFITTAIKGVNSSIDDLNKQISAWDDRLERRRTTLVRQFSAMDTAVSQFKSQGTWLAGQVSGLSKS